MNVLLHFLIATALIVMLILLRIFADRQALRSRLRHDHANTECEQSGCFRGCDLDKATADPGPVTEENALKRSAYHAP